MNDITAKALAKLDSLQKTPKLGHLTTSNIRSLSSKLFKDIKNEPADSIYSICEDLLEQRSWVLGVIAYDFAFRIKNLYDDKTFPLFESWLERYVRGWGDCDDFCTHAFGEFIRQKPELTEKTVKWTERGEFWMRRAAAVILIPAIHKGMHEAVNPLKVSDLLMADDHDLVRKGYGWMLKILSTREPRLVFDYLMQHRDDMPRVAFRYAAEKMPAEMRSALFDKNYGD